MNGEPLPIEHGFPVRMVVPGLYGFVSATKWVVDLELTTFDDFDAYWARRGLGASRRRSRPSRASTSPKPLARVAPGHGCRRRRRLGAAPRHRARSRCASTKARGERAELATERLDRHLAPVEITRGTHTAGNHKLEVRATDDDGDVQPEERVAPIPDGATGWHSVVVRVG